MGEGKYVVFTLGGQRFGLPIADVEQILPPHAVTRVPKSDRTIMGLFDLRGQTIPVVDTRVLLETVSPDPGCFIVVRSADLRVALTADAVQKIEDFQAAQIDAGDGVAGQPWVVARAQDTLVMLLDPHTLLPKKLQGKLTRSLQAA